MTDREPYTIITSTDTVSPELRDFAQSVLEILGIRNANLSVRSSKVAVVNNPLKDAIVELLEDDPADCD